MLTEKLFICE